MIIIFDFINEFFEEGCSLFISKLNEVIKNLRCRKCFINVISILNKLTFISYNFISLLIFIFISWFVSLSFDLKLYFLVVIPNYIIFTMCFGSDYKVPLSFCLYYSKC